MIERRIGLALTPQRIQIGCEAPLRERGTVDNGNHPVDGNATLYHRPLKCLNQWFRKREPGCLDHDVLDQRFPPKDRIQRRYEVISDGAAQTPIGKFDDVFLWAGRVAASFENLAVNTDVPELVHDHGQSAPLCRGQHVSDQGCLAGPEKARHDGTGHARNRIVHSSSSKLIGGTRAMRPRLSGCGLPRHGMMPSLALARRRAPSTSAGPQAASRPPKT